MVLNGGTMVNGSSDERQYKNVSVRSTGGVDPGWGKSTFNGVISGTGTFSQAGDGELRILSCAIKPGFSTGILNFHRTKGDFWFATNGAPVTLSIDVNGSGGVPGVNHDQVNVTGLQSGKDVDLANVNVVFSGTGGGAETIWFFTANLIVNGSVLASVSNAPGISSTIVYDYPGNRVGAIVVPEPAALLALACGALLLGRRRSRM
ncbi:MAG: PEP-CTERM sorting domain-containing protein [bacterium]|nr:PEP-CTERM sorting domain-containing protein [bacterium]